MGAVVALKAAFGTLGKMFNSDYGVVEDNNEKVNYKRLIPKGEEKTEVALEASMESVVAFAGKTVDDYSKIYSDEPEIDENDIKVKKMKSKKAKGGGVGTGNKNATMDRPFEEIIKVEPNKNAPEAAKRDSGGKERDLLRK